MSNFEIQVHSDSTGNIDAFVSVTSLWSTVERIANRLADSPDAQHALMVATLDTLIDSVIDEAAPVLLASVTSQAALN